MSDASAPVHVATRTSDGRPFAAGAATGRPRASVHSTYRSVHQRRDGGRAPDDRLAGDRRTAERDRRGPRPGLPERSGVRPGQAVEADSSDPCSIPAARAPPRSPRARSLVAADPPARRWARTLAAARWRTAQRRARERRPSAGLARVGWRTCSGRGPDRTRPAGDARRHGARPPGGLTSLGRALADGDRATAADRGAAG